jgi:hypothetical protein
MRRIVRGRTEYVDDISTPASPAHYDCTCVWTQISKDKWIKGDTKYDCPVCLTKDEQ